jgi:hypothetical protein
LRIIVRQVDDGFYLFPANDSVQCDPAYVSAGECISEALFQYPPAVVWAVAHVSGGQPLSVHLGNETLSRNNGTFAFSLG